MLAEWFLGLGTAMRERERVLVVEVVELLGGVFVRDK